MPTAPVCGITSETPRPKRAANRFRCTLPCEGARCMAKKSPYATESDFLFRPFVSKGSVTSRHNPPPSASLYFLVFCPALSISSTVSAITSLPNGEYFPVPAQRLHDTHIGTHRKSLALGARPRTVLDRKPR